MGAQRYNGDVPDLLDQIKQLRKRIEALERGPQAAFTSVSQGAIKVSDGASLIIGSSVTASETTPQVPIAILTYYAGFDIPIKSITKLFPQDGGYHYAVVGMFDPTTEFYAEGWVSANGVVNEFVNHLSAFDGTSGQVNYGTGPTPIESRFLGDASFQTGVSIEAGCVYHIDSGALYDIGGVSQGRGFVAQTVFTSNIVTGAISGTEYAGYVLGEITFLNGHAYRLVVSSGKMRSATAQQPAINLRTYTPGSPPTPGNAYVGGTILNQGPRMALSSTGVDLCFEPIITFVNSSGSDVVSGLTITVSPNAAQTVQLSAGAGALAVVVDIIDIGAASDWTGVQSL